MTRAKYVQLLNVAIERGQAADFREHFPTPDSCPDGLYEDMFPAAPAEVVEITAESEDEPEKESA